MTRLLKSALLLLLAAHSALAAQQSSQYSVSGMVLSVDRSRNSPRPTDRAFRTIPFNCVPEGSKTWPSLL